MSRKLLDDNRYRPKVAELAVVMEDPEAPRRVFELLTDVRRPLSLKAIAREWKVQRGAFVEWFMTKHAVLYEQALRVRAEELAQEALEISDDCAETVPPEQAVSAAKLQVDTRLKLAARYDRERYGDRSEVGLGSIENLAESLQRISDRRLKAIREAQDAPRVIEGEVIEQVEAMVAARAVNE